MKKHAINIIKNLLHDIIRYSLQHGGK